MLRGKRAKGALGGGGGGGDVVAMKPYPIGTAARLAGIPPETLRIWERRYRLLAPSRTEGGHRLYSERDVEVLRAVKRLVDAGMRVGSVAAMPPERILAEAATLPRDAGGRAGALAEGRGGALPEGMLPEGVPSEGALPEAVLLEDNEQLLAQIVESVRALDTTRTAALLDRPRLLTDGLDVVTSLYLPLLHRVGELWHDGELTVGQEHFVEKLVTARLHAILQSTAGPPHGRDGRDGRGPAGLALCACPPGERHEAGLLAASVALKAAGFAVALLGGDLPVPDLIAAARQLAPSLVVLAVANDLSDEARAALPRALERPPLMDVPLLLGGAAAGSLAALLARDHEVVLRVADVVATARRLTH